MKLFSLSTSVCVSFVLAASVSLLVSCSSSSVRKEVATLTIKDAAKGGRGISIETVNTQVTMVGNLAETTVDLVIRNSTSRVMEAALELPLPEGATISRYALDVNGMMREGVVVDKEQGRKAFDNTIRQRIDPGLLEKTKGNSFRTRIYPVPAGGTKHVLLSYTEPMQLNANGNYRYTLPLALKQRVKKFSLRMIANHGKSQILADGKLHGARYSKAGELSVSASNYKSSTQSFSIAATSAPQVMVQRGNDGSSYFYLSQEHHSHARHSRRPVSKVKLIWDTSYSSSQRDRVKDLQLLDAYFAHNSNLTVDLTFLSIGVSKATRYRVVNGEWSELRKTVENVIYDGATSMNKLSLTDPSYGAVLFFGDGVSTFDRGSKRVIRAGEVPVYLVNSSPSGNHALLRELADQSGGEYVNLYTTSYNTALELLVTTGYKLMKVTGGGVAQMKYVSRNKVSSISGKLSNSSAVLQLHYGVAGKILDVRKVSISRKKHQIEGSMAAKIWAQRQVNAYAANPTLYRSKIVRLAKTHRLVTDFTSLIVLDRVRDYVQYRIVPPTAALRKRYYEELKDVSENEQGKPADLDDVYKDWQRMVRWHKVGFPLAKNISRYDFKPIPIRKNRGYSAKGGLEGDYSAPMFVAPSVLNIVTGGNRSGDIAISRDSIDSFLNHPNARSSTGSKAKTATIAIKGWKPQSRYAKALSAAAKRGSLMSEYAKWKTNYQNSPSFYLDAAEVFLRNDQRAMAIKVLSNLAEIDSESAQMLRILAFRYSQMGEYALAEMLLREVVELRGEEPQSYRDLALVLAKRKRYSEASTLLWKVVNTTWDFRFNGIKMIVLNEWNQIQRKSNKKLSYTQRRFRYNIDADLRVVIVWDTDNSDMDLWVTTPDGGKCYYGNKLTKLGGKMSQDLTQGRGPEEFMIRRSSEGKYKIQANYYGTNEQTLASPTTLTARVITNWNRPNQKEEVITFKLGKEEQVIDIGEAGFR
ncbi:MAG: tetratricopeptide (TPR) repeat protein [Cryomorphaceae bacterium]|jgi:tetratricopeptide (TPR) repeat protein